jgi:DNA repair protein RecO (recombination protein O)
VSGPQSSLAIVLRWRSYGESDKIVTFLTRDFGKLTGIAKGAKSSKRRFANSLDLLARVRVHFRQRPQATLAFLESCELLVASDALARPARFAYASYLLELADQLTVEGQPVPDLYMLLEEALVALEQGPATGAFLRGFELKLLERAGFEPRLESCARCERLFVPARPAYLDVGHGTLWCSDCRGAGAGSIEVAEDLLRCLSRLKGLSLSECRRQSLGGSAAGAAQVTGHLLGLYLNRPLRSVKLIGRLAGETA